LDAIVQRSGDAPRFFSTTEAKLVHRKPVARPQRPDAPVLHVEDIGRLDAIGHRTERDGDGELERREPVNEPSVARQNLDARLVYDVDEAIWSYRDLALTA